MELMAILKLAPVVMSVVEIVKRIIPDKQRTVANPILAAVTGLIGAYVTGGQAEAVNTLLTGFTAALLAIGAYKIPKEAAKKMGIE